MRRWLLFLFLAFPCFTCAQTDPVPAAGFVRQYAAHYGVPPELIAALIDVESRWNPKAVSNKGAMGLMQLMPKTAQRFGAFEPFNVEQNIAAGTAQNDRGDLLRHTDRRLKLRPQVKNRHLARINCDCGDTRPNWRVGCAQVKGSQNSNGNKPAKLHGFGLLGGLAAGYLRSW